MMSICSWEHPRTLSSLPVMAYEECGFEDNSKQSRWQTTPRTAVTAENRSNAILASFSLFSFSMLPVIILRILVFQCEDRHIFLHLQRFGATTVRQNCTKKGSLVVRNDPYVGLANRWFQPLTHLSGSHLAKLPPRAADCKDTNIF